MNNILDLIRASRTCRRFRGSDALTGDDLTALVSAARLSPSARNAQPLRYILVSSPEVREALFPLLVLGGGLAPGQRAAPHQHPGGYIIIFGPDRLENFGLMDVGIAAQSINLAANDAGFACCMIGAFNKPALHDLLTPPEGLDAKLVIAVGVPDEERRITLARMGETAYYRDADDTHCVPKLSVDDLVIARR